MKLIIKGINKIFEFEKGTRRNGTFVSLYKTDAEISQFLNERIDALRKKAMHQLKNEKLIKDEKTSGFFYIAADWGQGVTQKKGGWLKQHLTTVARVYMPDLRKSRCEIDKIFCAQRYMKDRVLKVITENKNYFFSDYNYKKETNVFQIRFPKWQFKNEDN